MGGAESVPQVRGASNEQLNEFYDKIKEEDDRIIQELRQKDNREKIFKDSVEDCVGKYLKSAQQCRTNDDNDCIEAQMDAFRCAYNLVDLVVESKNSSDCIQKLENRRKATKSILDQKEN